MNNTLDYAFLTPVIEEWVRNKCDLFLNIKDHFMVWDEQLYIDPNVMKTPFKKLCTEIDISEEEFAKQFLDPWKNLSQSQIDSVLRYWNWAHRFRFGQELILKPIKEIQALQWCVIQIYLLNLSGVTLFNYPPQYFEDDHGVSQNDYISRLFQSELHCLPYKQCFYCGKLDTDPRGKTFKKKGLKFCHQSKCVTSSVNLPDHELICCSRQWNSIKYALKRTLSNNYSSKEKVTKIFLMFCDERYEYGLSIENRVRPEMKKPELWKFPWTDLENRTYE